MTRQQRRQQRRKDNKKIYNASKSFANRIKMDAEGQQQLAGYRIGSKHPAILMHGMCFEKDSTLQDYIHLCHEAAGGFEDIAEPQWILLIRESDDVVFPAPKSELVKIGTRIFKKSLNRPFLFLDLTVQELESGGAEHRIVEFMLKFAEVPEDADIPDWMFDYYYKEHRRKK